MVLLGLLIVTLILCIIGKILRYEYILMPQSRQIGTTETNFYRIDRLTNKYCVANEYFSQSKDRLTCVEDGR